MREKRWGTCLYGVLLALAVLIVCTGCGIHGPEVGKKADFSYVDGAFTVEVTGQSCRTVPDGYTGSPATVGEGRTGVAWSWRARVSAEAPGPSGECSVSVTYLEPASLAGLTVTRTVRPAKAQTGEDTTAAGGKGAVNNDPGAGLITTVTVSLGGVSTEVGEGVYDRLLAPADALFPDGDILSVGEDAEGHWTVTVGPPITEGRRAVFTFGEGADFPTAVRVSDTYGWLELEIVQKDGGAKER